MWSWTFWAPSWHSQQFRGAKHQPCLIAFWMLFLLAYSHNVNFCSAASSALLQMHLFFQPCNTEFPAISMALQLPPPHNFGNRAFGFVPALSTVCCSLTKCIIFISVYFSKLQGKGSWLASGRSATLVPAAVQRVNEGPYWTVAQPLECNKQHWLRSNAKMQPQERLANPRSQGTWKIGVAKGWGSFASSCLLCGGFFQWPQWWNLHFPP